MSKIKKTKMNKIKLAYTKWVEKYFEKDDDHSYYTWTYTDDGMHPNDKSRWKTQDLKDEYQRYLDDNEKSHIGLDEYDE